LDADITAFPSRAVPATIPAPKTAKFLPKEPTSLLSLENAEIGWLINNHCAILCVIYLQKGVVGRQILLKLCAIQLVQRNHVL
jgi:hypothetical protein